MIEVMANLFHQILYRPLLNVLVFFYNTIAFHDLGVAIALLAIFVRLILYPLFHKSTRHQTMLQRLQPHVKKISDTVKDKQKQMEAIMALYKEHDVSLSSVYFVLILQFPFLIAIYGILRNLNSNFSKDLYSFIHAPAVLAPMFLGLINLADKSILMVSLAAIAQYIQSIIALPKIQKGITLTSQEKMTRRMVFLGPIITLVIFYRLPAAVSLYWFVTTLFSIGQQMLINKSLQSWNTGTTS